MGKAKATPARVEAEISDRNSDLSDSDDDLFVLVEKPKKASPGKKKSKENEKPICKLCQDEFQSSSALIRHISKTHKDTSLTYVCAFCTKRFAKKVNFNQHIKTHKSK